MVVDFRLRWLVILVSDDALVKRLVDHLIMHYYIEELKFISWASLHNCMSFGVLNDKHCTYLFTLKMFGGKLYGHLSWKRMDGIIGSRGWLRLDMSLLNNHTKTHFVLVCIWVAYRWNFPNIQYVWTKHSEEGILIASSQEQPGEMLLNIYPISTNNHLVLYSKVAHGYKNCNSCKFSDALHRSLYTVPKMIWDCAYPFRERFISFYWSNLNSQNMKLIVFKIEFLREGNLF